MSYSQVLFGHGVAHVYNHWSSMPSLAEQHTQMQGFTAAFTVLRLHTPLKMTYEAAKKRAEPYTKIVGELPAMRRDAVSLVAMSTAEAAMANLADLSKLSQEINSQSNEVNKIFFRVTCAWRC